MDHMDVRQLYIRGIFWDSLHWVLFGRSSASPGNGLRLRVDNGGDSAIPSPGVVSLHNIPFAYLNAYPIEK
jgi:hypothetical protein